MKKNSINLEYFSKPKPKIINRFYLSKYRHEKIDLYNKEPCIYVTPNTSVIDKALITSCINTKFLFINDDIIDKINEGSLSKEKQRYLLKEIENLSKDGYVFSLVWNNSPTIFGDNEPISKNLSMFLYQTKLDIKFLTFPGLYYSHPVWSTNPKKTKIFSNQKIILRHKMLEGFNEKEIVKSFYDCTPSSASAYTNKFPISYKSNNLAEGLERIMYCCPDCENLCTLYSEFSCIKCKECCSVYELSSDGEILFSQKISNFDDIKNYQISTLKRKDFSIKPIVEYKNITQIFHDKCKKVVKINVILQIYADKLIITNPIINKKTEIVIEDIDLFTYTHNNNVHIKTKNAKEFNFIGNNNENLFIIKDLIQLNKN